MKNHLGLQATAIRAAAALAVAIFLAPAGAIAQTRQTARNAKSFAQKLVEETQARHPEADEIGISAITRRGCYGIASTDKGDIGEKCEKDDLAPMRNGKPYVEKERDGFDVSLPLHDAAGRLVGSVGIGFRVAAGQTEASVTAQARKIAKEMEARISAKAALFSRGE